jgi:deoxyribodipyrimidine photo-lyase
MREVVLQTRARIADLPPQASRHRAGLSAFLSRLYWHCHFIQKLESEPAIEWRNMHTGYDGLREQDFNPAYFEALKEARTGWPMVDACVTMLRETGWLNFRMRAMLVSVAAYPLWLHWRPVGEWLATQFLDYEPGIHWSQLQMQSGTTGINTTRVYNPVKQAQDHDPYGKFVRHWLPPMRQVPDTWLFEPWLMPAQMCNASALSAQIVQPVVDLAIATREAKQRLYARRKTPEVVDGKKAVVEKHASRQSLKSRKKTIAKTQVDETQMGFNF